MQGTNESSIFDEYFNAQKELEEKYGSNSIVLMMVGSFYEMYEVNTPNLAIGKAEIAHNILGMNMSSKNKNKEHSKYNPYMVGFPDYALDEHLGKFLRANYIVGVYNQYDKDCKGVKKGRRLEHVYTPSTFIDDTVNSNNLMAIEINEYVSPISKKLMKKAHIAVLCTSTGKSFLLEVYDTLEDSSKTVTDVYRIIHTYDPSEIIYCGQKDCKFSRIYDIENKKVYFREIPKTFYKLSYQKEFLQRVYHLDALCSPIEYFNLEKHSSVIPHFMQALQFAYEQDKFIIEKIQKPIFIQDDNQLILNNDSLYQLNLINHYGDNTKTLFDIVCKAKTSIGKRMLRQTLLNPIRDSTELEKRYDLVEKMTVEYKNYEDILRGIADIEKKYRKMVFHTLHPYELADLKDTFISIKKLLKQGKSIFDIKDQVIDDYKCFYNEYIGNFDFDIMKTCKINDIKGSFFIEGVNEELDSYKVKISNAIKLLNDIANNFCNFIKTEKDKVIKVESTTKEGWYLLISSSRFKLLSKDASYTYIYNGKNYTIKHSDFEITNLKNTLKIRSPQIRKISGDILNLTEAMNTKIIDEYNKILDHYTTAYFDNFENIINIIGLIDTVYSSAKVAVEYGYTRPIIKNNLTGASYINIKDLRHPIIERIIEDTEYIPNDISLGEQEHYGSLIYGLNMSGKSSLIRALGCNIVLAQAGMYASCKEMVFYPFRNLLSKMTIRDNISLGQSTFMVEMLEVKSMLTKADANTIILSDELCSSTESVSGHSIVAETLHFLTQKRAKFVFSTHLHDLQNIPIIKDNNFINIYHFKVHVKGEKIVFDRKLDKGGLSELYGLEVAKALGLPKDFIKGALEVRDFLTNNNVNILSLKSSRYNGNVYLHECENCGEKINLETHHKYPQKDADKNGLIDGRIHKNLKFNLQVLCKECHKKETFKK